MRGKSKMTTPHSRIVDSISVTKGGTFLGSALDHGSVWKNHPDFMACFILAVKVSAGVWRSSHMLSISFVGFFFLFFLACCYISTVIALSLYGGI